MYLIRYETKNKIKEKTATNISIYFKLKRRFAKVDLILIVNNVEYCVA